MERKHGLRFLATEGMKALASAVLNGMEQNKQLIRRAQQHGTPTFARRISSTHRTGTPNKYKPHIGAKQIAKLAGTYPNRFGQGTYGVYLGRAMMQATDAQHG